MSKAHTNASRIALLDGARIPFLTATKRLPDGTPKYVGKIAHIHPAEYQIPIINALVERNGIAPADIGLLRTGCAFPENVQGLDIARQSIRLSGENKPEYVEPCVLPPDLVGVTESAFCISSLITIADAVGDVLKDPSKAYIATGVESMSQVYGGFNYAPHPSTFAHDSQTYEYDSMTMISTADALAKRYGIATEAANAYALESHKRASAAQKAGYFAEEIVPIAGYDADDGIRHDATMEGLAKLRPVYAGGSVTPGTASIVSDGAAGVLLASEDWAEEHGITPMAFFVADALKGNDPGIMGLGPVFSMSAALDKAGLTMDQIGVVEINEAFPQQVLAVLAEMKQRGQPIDQNRLNIDGGATALGHPLGSSGARLVQRAARIAQRLNEKFFMVSACGATGISAAQIWQNAHYDPSKPSASGLKLSL